MSFFWKKENVVDRTIYYIWRGIDYFSDEEAQSYLYPVKNIFNLYILFETNKLSYFLRTMNKLMYFKLQISK